MSRLEADAEFRFVMADEKPAFEAGFSAPATTLRVGIPHDVDLFQTRDGKSVCIYFSSGSSEASLSFGSLRDARHIAKRLMDAVNNLKSLPKHIGHPGEISNEGEEEDEEASDLDPA